MKERKSKKTKDNQTNQKLSKKPSHNTGKPIKEIGDGIAHEIVGKEFGGWFGALFLMLTFTPLIILIHLICNSKKCTWTNFPSFETLTNINIYNDPTAVFALIGYLLLITIISRVPGVGRTVKDPPTVKHKRREYKINSRFTITIVLVLILVLELMEIPVLETIRGKFLELCITSLLLGWLITFGLYAHSFIAPKNELNPYGTIGNYIYDFFMGRTCCPRILGFDIKLILYRASMLGVIIINIAYFIKSLQNKIQQVSTSENPISWLDVGKYWDMELSTVFTPMFLINIYMSDYFMYEWRMLTSFEYMYEGAGYMLGVGYMSYPFIITNITKYASEHGINMETWQLILIWIVFLTALYVESTANKQKNEFRNNPNSITMKRMESIPTPQGKRLLVSGLWGTIRHPNYVSDLTMHVCLCQMAPYVPPVVMPLICMYVVLYRIVRDDKRCEAKYGSAWQQYRERVKYNLIPGIY